MAKKTDVAPRQQFEAISALMDKLAIEVGAEGDNRDDVYSIMENILSGETSDDVFDAQEAGTVSSKDYLNTPFWLDSEGIQWKRSSVQEGFPYYALLRVADADGASRILSAGGFSCVAVLNRLQELGYLDEAKPLMFIEKPVSSGYSVLLLKPVAGLKR